MPRNNCSPPWFAAAFVLLVVVAIPAVSRAQTCASNADCAAGLTCQISAVPPQPTVDPGCVKGQTCAGPAPEEKVSTPAPVQSSTCQVAPCKLDSDCVAGMICHTEKYASCSGGSSPPCPANTVCEVAPKPTTAETCVEITSSTCAFKWQLPCNTDQDCGNDFLCTPAVGGTCSSGGGVAGGGGTGAGGGSGTATPVASDPAIGSPVAPRDPDGSTGIASDGGATCTTVTSFPGYCQPRAITCLVDADCPTSWTCIAPPMTVTRGAPPVADDSTSSTTAVTGTPVPVGPKLCHHPVYGDGGRGTATDVGNAPTAPGGDASGQPPMVGKASSENASGSGGAGCAVAGAGGSAGVPLLGGVLFGLLVSGLLRVRLLTVRRRTARLNR